MRQTSAQPTLATVVKTVAFLICAWVSAAHMTDYWVIGPTFGLVVLVWRSTDVDALFKPDALAFLIASTLIYALVVRLQDTHINGLGVSSDVPLEIAVGVGTILLPLAHARFLKAPWKRAAIAIPAIYITWFVLSSALSALNSESRIGQKLSEALDQFQLLNLASIWQAAYLAFMFWPGLEPGRGSRRR